MAFSSTYYGQRKRRREEKQNDSLRLIGGAGRAARPPAQRRNRGALALDPGLAPARVNAHQLWNLAAQPQFLHFHIPTDFDPNPLGEEHENRISEWVPDMVDDLYPWYPTGIAEADAESDILHMGRENAQGFRYNNLVAINDPARPPPMSNIRQLEIAALQAHGAFLDTVLQIPGGIPTEPKWSFMGMADSRTYGIAWSCFYYALSDMYHDGFVFASDICMAISQIAEDIIQITNGLVGYETRCAILFEGKTDAEYANDREFIFSTRHDQTLGSVINSPTAVLDAMLQYFTSENNGFLFYRAYFHVLTDLARGGDGLRLMPPKFIEMRNGPLFKGVKGFSLIEDNEDCSCGINAIIWAMSNSLKRISKVYKLAQKAAPELCRKFEHYRARLNKNSSNSKIKLLHSETRAEMASYIGWKSGETISKDQICEIVKKYSEAHRLDLGVIIFDAIDPLNDFTANYDPEVHVPDQIICLVHWQYPWNQDTVTPSGHYDCIDSTNVTTWLLKKRGINRKDLRFSFRRFGLFPASEADDKGLNCVRCKHWQKGTPLSVWNKLHGVSPGARIITCPHCEVKFASTECYDLHLQKAHGSSTSACESIAMCKKCKKVHRVQYDCSQFYCAVCMKKFPMEEKKGHICYLKHISERKCARLRKVVYSDMEGSRKAGYHEAVCIASCWSRICAKHEQISNRGPSCACCKLHSDNWGYFCNEHLKDNELECSNNCEDCDKKHTKYFIGKKCLSDYLDWVMTEFAGGTVVFHNGGRYDLQILIQEFMLTGKYILDHDAARGTQIIFFTAVPNDAEFQKKKFQVRFIDSYNFVQSSLRNFPVMFDLKSVAKGRFPYDLLNTDNWENWKGRCPDASFFGVTEKELKNVNSLSAVRGREVKEILEYIDESNKNYELKGEPWVALDVLKYYTEQDTIVLHDGCEVFRRNFWELTGVDPFQWVTLASAVAGSYRQEEFMPPCSIQIFSNVDREWQRQALRGGRCEPLKLYWKATKPSESFKWYDVNSEYPFVQAYGYYPIGAVTLDLKYNKPVAFDKFVTDFRKKCEYDIIKALKDPSGASGCGIIECNIETAMDTHLPILPSKVKMDNGYVKNMFQIRSGTWIGFLTLLAEAIKAGQVLIKTVTRIQFWGTTSNKLFRNFLCRLYAAKVEASGWEKILNKKAADITEEEKLEYLRESKKRGIVLDAKNIYDNPGRRATAKIMNNCGWGYLCQKPHADENLFFDNLNGDDIERMGDLLDSLGTDKNPRRIIGQPTQVGKYTRIRTTKKAEDITVEEMNKKVAYAVGGQVPAYGMQLLGSTMLKLMPCQLGYCDTDSIGFVLDTELLAEGKHKDIKTGPYLGDWVDEYPGQRITEFCSLGCKTYFMRIESLDGKKVSYKGRFKGIPLTSATFSLLDKQGEIAKIGMEEMKRMLFQALKSQAMDPLEDAQISEVKYEFFYTNFFKRGPDYKIRPVNERKSIRFTYDKRKILVPDSFMDERASEEEEQVCDISTDPIDDLSSRLLSLDVNDYWEKRK